MREKTHVACKGLVTFHNLHTGPDDIRKITKNLPPFCANASNPPARQRKSTDRQVQRYALTQGVSACPQKNTALFLPPCGISLYAWIKSEFWIKLIFTCNFWFLCRRMRSPLCTHRTKTLTYLWRIVSQAFWNAERRHVSHRFKLAARCRRLVVRISRPPHFSQFCTSSLNVKPNHLPLFHERNHEPLFRERNHGPLLPCRTCAAFSKHTTLLYISKV